MRVNERNRKRKVRKNGGKKEMKIKIKCDRKWQNKGNWEDKLKENIRK